MNRTVRFVRLARMPSQQIVQYSEMGCRDCFCFPHFSLPPLFSSGWQHFDRINPSIESRNDITLMTPPVGRRIPHYVLASGHEPCAPLINPGAEPRVQTPFFSVSYGRIETSLFIAVLLRQPRTAAGCVNPECQPRCGAHDATIPAQRLEPFRSTCATLAIVPRK